MEGYQRSTKGRGVGVYSGEQGEEEDQVMCGEVGVEDV